MIISINEIQKDLFNSNNKYTDIANYYGIILDSDIGECLTVTEINSESSLNRLFGSCNIETNYREFSNIKNFLNYSNNLKVVRPINQTIKNKQNNYDNNNPPIKTQISNFYNTTVAKPSLIVTDRLAIVEKFPNINEDISIAICSSDSNWNKEISYEKINLVISRSVTTPPEIPMDNDMYLLPTGSTGDWLGYDGQYAIWLRDNDAWNFVSVLSNDTIFVKDENLEYEYISGTWVVQQSYYNQFDHIKYKNESAYRIVYDESIQNSFGKILKFSQFFSTKPHFNNDDFLILIFKKNKMNKFVLVEKFQTNYTTAESDINFKSNYIYIKIESVLNTNKIETSGYSIVDSRLQHSSDTNLTTRKIDYEKAVELLNNDISVGIISDFEFDGTMNLVSDKLKSLGANKILISGCYDNARYSSFTDVIDDFGAFRNNGYSNFNDYENYAAIASMRLDNTIDKIVPFYGDIIGLIFQNLKFRSAAGMRCGRLADVKKITYSIKNNNNNSINCLLSQNNINNISWDSDLKINYVTNDAMNNSSNMNISYSLLFNQIEQAIGKYFTEYVIKCPRIKETEKLKNIIINKILKDYGVTSDVSYTIIDGTQINYIVSLYYKSVVKEIIVNIIY